MINYKEKKVIEGYDFLDEGFEKVCAQFGFNVLHWRSGVVPIVLHEIDVQKAPRQWRYVGVDDGCEGVFSENIGFG